MKLTIDQSPEYPDLEITIKCSRIDEKLSIRALLNGKFEARLDNEEKIVINRHYVQALKAVIAFERRGSMLWVRQFWAINCYTYTCLILLYAVLAGVGLFPSLEWHTILVMFLLTSGITISIVIAEVWMSSRVWITHLIRLLLITGIVFGFGYLADFFSFEPIYVLIVGGMNILIYVAVFGLMLIQTQAEAREVNKRLVEFKRQQGERNDGEDH